MKKVILAACAATVLSTSVLSTSVYADTLLGVYIGGNIWHTETEGSFGETRDQNNFDFDDESNGSFYIAIEHPIPALPNLKISSTDLSTDGDGALDFSFEGVSGEATTTFDTNFVDYTLYYELFDNDLISIDFGLTARDIDADVQVASASNEGELNVSGIIPMLYLAAEVGLPATPFNIFANGNLLSIDDNTVSDYQVGIGYEIIDNIAVDVDLTLGYRSIKLELDDLDDLTSDLEFDGFFFGAVVHF